MRKGRKTAGELSVQAARDTSRYDTKDLGLGMIDTIEKGVWECINAHDDFFDIPQFCVVMLTCDDSILKNAKRLKFYAWPFLPKPRPRQTVFLYHKATDKIQYLWSLPTAEAMTALSTLLVVKPEYKRMKTWCDAFYTGTFHDVIRQQANITLPTEDEYSAKLRSEKPHSGTDLVDAFFPESFDFFKPFEGQKIVDTKDVVFHSHTAFT